MMMLPALVCCERCAFTWGRAFAGNLHVAGESNMVCCRVDHQRRLDSRGDLFRVEKATFREADAGDLAGTR